MVGDGSRILFWHDRWVGDTSLKMLYPQLYACSNDKEACISDLLCHQESVNNRFWNLRFYRNSHERELEAAFLVERQLTTYFFIVRWRIDYGALSL